MLFNFFLKINLNNINTITKANIIIIDVRFNEVASGEIITNELIINIRPVDNIRPKTTGFTPLIKD